MYSVQKTIIETNIIKNENNTCDSRIYIISVDNNRDSVQDSPLNNNNNTLYNNMVLTIV